MQFKIGIKFGVSFVSLITENRMMFNIQKVANLEDSTSSDALAVLQFITVDGDTCHGKIRPRSIAKS
jgi:hypothetical protein